MQGVGSPRSPRTTLRPLFDRYDTDGDGSLELEELRNLVEDVMHVPCLEDTSGQQLMEELDEDGNGKVSFEELAKVYTRFMSDTRTFRSPHPTPARPGVQDSVFCALRDHWLAAGGGHDLDTLSTPQIGFLRRRFNACDVDGDGCISKEDLRTVLAQIQGREATNDEVNGIFERLATNSASQITFYDFLHAILSLRHGLPPIESATPPRSRRASLILSSFHTPSPVHRSSGMGVTSHRGGTDGTRLKLEDPAATGVDVQTHKALVEAVTACGSWTESVSHSQHLVRGFSNRSLEGTPNQDVSRLREELADFTREFRAATQINRRLTQKCLNSRFHPDALDEPPSDAEEDDAEGSSIHDHSPIAQKPVDIFPPELQREIELLREEVGLLDSCLQTTEAKGLALQRKCDRLLDEKRRLEAELVEVRATQTQLEGELHRTKTELARRLAVETARDEQNKRLVTLLEERDAEMGHHDGTIKLLKVMRSQHETNLLQARQELRLQLEEAQELNDQLKLELEASRKANLPPSSPHPLHGGIGAEIQSVDSQQKLELAQGRCDHLEKALTDARSLLVKREEDLDHCKASLWQATIQRRELRFLMHKYTRLGTRTTALLGKLRQEVEDDFHDVALRVCGEFQTLRDYADRMTRERDAMAERLAKEESRSRETDTIELTLDEAAELQDVLSRVVLLKEKIMETHTHDRNDPPMLSRNC